MQTKRRRRKIMLVNMFLWKQKSLLKTFLQWFFSWQTSGGRGRGGLGSRLKIKVRISITPGSGISHMREPRWAFVCCVFKTPSNELGLRVIWTSVSSSIKGGHISPATGPPRAGNTNVWNYNFIQITFSMFNCLCGLKVQTKATLFLLFLTLSLLESLRIWDEEFLSVPKPD